MNEEKKVLKLFVVGESSGNPDDWRERPNRALVVASSAEEAIALAWDKGSSVAELQLNNPCVIFADESGLILNM